MINLPQSETEQMISFIPRILEASSVTVTNELSKIEQSFTPEFYLNDYYLSCYIILDLIENQFYKLEIKDAENNVIYLDKIFCTNQNTDSFSINKDLYIYE